MTRIATAAAFLVLVLAACSGEALDKTDQVRIVYTEPKSLAHQKVLQTLRDRQFLEKMRKILSPLELPRRVTVKVTSCNGKRNAFYDNAVITICYDYLDFIMENAAKAPHTIGISTESAWMGATFDLVLHEVGHAVFDTLTIPVLGREEDAADSFSAYIMLQFPPAQAHNLIAGTAFLALTEARETQPNGLSPKIYADEHGLPMQRYFNLLCTAYGADPKTFADILARAHFPEKRQEGCKDDYKQIKYAFKTLIDPHVDERLARKVGAHF